jgi:uncharacterized protein YqeY
MYRENIDKQIASAMKNGEHIKLTVWRAIKNEFMKFQTSGANMELTDEKELQIINKMVQQRKDSIEQYLKANREELASVEEQEMEILSSLLPNEPTEDDIKTLIESYIKEKEITPKMQDLRNVMSFIKIKFPTVDGGKVSKIFRENYI